ncbi:amidohydrolase family protein [Ihubacter sp. rT4E-8]|uniref:amidohydrolase family protein n=1 Tax=Ihubacter sp. rT4E-8 TaxID=3242369 RepID=UPI003CF5910D
MFDILIKNGLICDGTGASSYEANLGITGDRITYIGKEYGADAKAAVTVIDAAGKVITPGFIDTHTHADLSMMIELAMEPFVKQGVTTVITGNCGYSMAPQGDEIFYFPSTNQTFQELAGADPADQMPLLYPREKAQTAFETLYGVEPDWRTFAEYSKRCDSMALGCNAAPLVGYSAVRTAVMGQDCLREDTNMVADFIAPVLGESVDIFCQYDYAMPCSDGFGYAKETNLTGKDEFPAYPNSMNIGLMPRYLTRYGKDDFEQAVRRASGFPAQRFGIQDRGVLKEGYYADLVVLDRENLHSFDEEENPLQDPCGIDYVFVNGKAALTPDGLTGAGTGRMLRK